MKFTQSIYEPFGGLKNPGSITQQAPAQPIYYKFPLTSPEHLLRLASSNLQPRIPIDQHPLPPTPTPLIPLPIRQHIPNPWTISQPINLLKIRL